MIDVTPSDAVEEAAWIAPRLRPFRNHQAGSVVPSGFDAYARIDHERAGQLPETAARRLVRLLPASGDVWIALWDGYGFLHPGSAMTTLFASAGSPTGEPQVPLPSRTPSYPATGWPRIQLPCRNYLLYRGGAELIPGWMDGPNLWWPDDRSWCVASEIDLPWTYVGGSAAVIAGVLDDAGLAVRALSLDESTLAQDHPELGQRL